MRLEPSATLIVIDVQQAFDNPAWGERSTPEAEANIAALLAAWRAAGMRVIHVHHINPRSGSLFNPGSPGAVVKPEAAPLPGEPVIQKDVNSAFIGTDLESRLRAVGSPALVMAGFTTDHCVSTTARMAANFGFEVLVVADASNTYQRSSVEGRSLSAATMHETALASLNGEFATVVTTAQVKDAVQALQPELATGASQKERR